MPRNVPDRLSHTSNLMVHCPLWMVRGGDMAASPGMSSELDFHES